MNLSTTIHDLFFDATSQMHWSPNSEKIVFTSTDAQILIYDTDLNLFASLESGCEAIYTVCWSPQSDHILWSAGRNYQNEPPNFQTTFEVWNLLAENQSGPWLFRSDPSFWVTALSWNYQNDLIAIGGSDYRITLWDWKSKEIIAALQGHLNSIHKLKWLTHDLLLSVGASGEIIIWKVPQEQRKRVQFEDIHYWDYDPHQNYLLMGTIPGKIVAYNPIKNTVKFDFRLEGQTTGMRNFSLNPQSSFICGVANATYDAAVWNAQDGRLISQFHAEKLREIAWHPSGKFLVTIDWDGKINFFDAMDGSQIALLEVPETKSLYNLSWSPNGKTLLILSDFNDFTRVYKVRVE